MRWNFISLGSLANFCSDQTGNKALLLLAAQISQRFILSFFLLCHLVFAIGCQRPDSTTSPDKKTAQQTTRNSVEIAVPFSDDLDGATLLRNLTTKYGLAKSYRDKGILRLSYTLQDKAIIEPHPFSTCWERGERLSCRLFQAHLQSDGKFLSCFVYDINTANLDEQQLFLPVDQELPLNQLFEDSIVRHYLGGYADLPLDETDKIQIPKLIPPPISLVTSQLPFGWISNPQVAKRLPDQQLETRKCYVVRSQFNEMTADIWIDQDTKLLLQVSLPLKIMDRQVLTSGEIKNVELLMQFNEAQLDIPIESTEHDRFSVSLRPKAIPVRRFISVPDPFPSERIGQLVPKFELQRPNGDKVDYLYYDGKTTVFFWIGGAELATFEKSFQYWKTRLDPKSTELALVYSDAELKQTDANLPTPGDEIAELAKRTGLSLLFDKQQQTSAKFQLRLLPAVAVIGPSSRLEFVGALNKQGWEKELEVVTEKVQRGVDVAGEMKQAYQDFQENYSKQRVAASARSMLKLPEPQPVANVTPTNSSDMTLANSLKPTIVWSNKSLTQPGNVAVNHFRSPPTLLVMDGWRSVVELEMNGKELGRFELELPEQSAVSCLRMIPAEASEDPNEVHFAAFNVQGEKIYLFDRNWKLVSTLPPVEFAHDGIRDALFVTRDGGSPLMIVALANDGGCVEFDNQSRMMKQVFRSRADSIARLGNRVYFANPTKWGLLKDDGDQNELPDDLMFQKLVALPATIYSNQEFVGITTVDRDNNWSFGRIGSDNKLVWRQPIGSQLFENEIEPLSCCTFQFDQHDGQPESGNISAIAVVAVADSGNRVTMISGEGSFLGQFSAPAPLCGIAIVEDQGSLHLILSTKQGIANYRLSAGSAKALPVSNKKAP